MQDILQRFAGKPYTPTVSQIAQLDERLATISKYYFDALVEFETSILIGLIQVNEKELSNDSGRMDYLRIFKDELAAMLRETYKECIGINVAHFLLLHYFETHKSPGRYGTLDHALKVLFKKPGELVESYFLWSNLKKDIPTYIACAAKHSHHGTAHARHVQGLRRFE
jgi:hypothetical protein